MRSWTLLVAVNYPWEASELFGKINMVDDLLPSLEQYCAELSTELSGIEVNQRMFRRMGGMWLLHIVHQVLAMENNQVCNTDLSSLTIPFDSSTHHIRFVSSESYRSQLRVLSQSAAQGTLRDIKTATTDFVTSPSMSRIRQRFELLLQASARSEPRVTVVRPYLKISSIERTRAILRSKSVCRWNDMEVTHGTRVLPDIKSRMALVRMIHSSDLESVVKSILPLVLPIG